MARKNKKKSRCRHQAPITQGSRNPPRARRFPPEILALLTTLIPAVASVIAARSGHTLR
ncbi:hypothetical protein ACIGXM_36325 [Kitasatospora sp. NPDC052896]|uniref:hypothetical protein n=1 Tax=Kitasatospora sp. NPDC052896 TaxID=3364061 RepID=UPI0037C864D9